VDEGGKPRTVSFHSKSLDDLIADDIDALLGQEETSQLDFKRELPSGTEQDKLEFVADVCSMWRRGGDIVFGVRDEEGVAVEVCGLADVDLDAARLRLDQLVESRIDPRLPSVQFSQSIAHPSGPILVLRIAQSWQGPHGVRVGEGFRFPIRGASARKTYLDFEQLRSEFAGGEELQERVRTFRDGRVAAIVTGDTPIPTWEGAKMITHVVPVSTWLDRHEIDTLQMDRQGAFRPSPRRSGGGSGTHNYPNLEGFITFDQLREQEPAPNYLQSFRNGAFERVATHLFRATRAEGGYPEKRLFGFWFEQELIHGVEDVIELLRHVEIAPPIVVFATLVDVRGWVIFSGDWRADHRDRLRLPLDVMRLPDVIVDDFDAELPRVLRPIIETFWQAGGWLGSPSYDDDGNWQLLRK
jgi:hypothetical protein